MMKRKIMIFLLAILTSSGLWKEARSQINPKDDPNFEKVDSKSDEFNSFDNSKWYKIFCYPAGGCWGTGGMIQSHATCESGSLVLKLDTLTLYNPKLQSTINDYWAAGVKSKNFDFSYGYLEINAKLPGYLNNGQPCGTGMWPTFWAYYEEVVNDCWNILDEIDIVEPSGAQYADARTNVFGWHDEIGNCQRDKVGEYYHTNLPVLFNAYHKFAVEWLPQRLIYYYDDVPIYSSFDDNSVPNHSLKVLISFQLGGGGSTLNENTPLPHTMLVNYFRYYRLIDDYCGQNASITSNSQLNGFNYGIRENIVIRNCSLSSGDTKVFRASNEINITSNFTVPIGSELYLIPTASPCN